MSDINTFDAVQALQQQIESIRADFNGKKLFQASFMISLVFDEPKSRATQTKMIDAIKLYYRWTQDELTWWVAEGGRPKNLAKCPIDWAVFEKLAENDNAALGFALGSGSQLMKDRLSHAQDFTIAGLANSFMAHVGTGYVEMYFPIEWVMRQPEEWRFYAVARGLMETLQPLHATAGLGLCIPQEGRHFYRDIGESAFVYEMAKRHPGIEVCDGYTSSSFKTGIYTVNWLNYICAPFVERLAGTEAVKTQCAALALPCHDVGQGLLIEAGPGPAPGDIQDPAQVLIYYQRAMQVLKPLRVASYRNRMLVRPKPGFDQNYDESIGNQACMAYLTRFDENPVPWPV